MFEPYREDLLKEMVYACGWGSMSGERVRLAKAKPDPFGERLLSPLSLLRFLEAETDADWRSEVVATAIDVGAIHADHSKHVATRLHAVCV